jgi:hypothetical protein
MDALDLLRAQHAEILGLFKRTSTLDAGDRWCALDILVEAIDLHLRVMPLCIARASPPRSERLKDVASLRHIRDELTELDPADAQFAARRARIHDDVLLLCRRQQQRLFPALERQLDESARRSLAMDLLQAIAQFEREPDPRESDHRLEASS